MLTCPAVRKTSQRDIGEVLRSEPQEDEYAKEVFFTPLVCFHTV